jgi:hypothetical protein
MFAARCETFGGPTNSSYGFYGHPNRANFPMLAQKHDQDLRDTCVMRLDRAGCDLLTICDITGHSYRARKRS